VVTRGLAHFTIKDKGHPAFGVFLHGFTLLVFWTPKVPLLTTEIPRGSKKIGGKGVIKTTSKKARALSFLQARWGLKKKPGLRRRKFVVFLVPSDFGPICERNSTNTCNISGPIRVLCFFILIPGHLFLTRIGHVRVWVPFSAK
jgi:hypothetical protein